MDRPASPMRLAPALCLILASCSPADPDAFTLTPTRDGVEIALGADVLARFDLPKLGEVGAPTLGVREAGGPWKRVSLVWEPTAAAAQDELAVRFDLEMEPDFWWAPHLAPEDGNVVAQHVFRSPAVIVADGERTVAVVPDLDLVGRRTENPWFLDFDALAGRFELGMTRTSVDGHVLFRKEPGMRIAPGRVEIAFYVTAFRDPERAGNPWARVAGLLWDRWGRPAVERGEPLASHLAPYVEHTYRWAFDTWGDFVWQEFDLDGKRVGAPQFIVNVSQSPNHPGPWYQRESLSIWNQAWFSSLRSASGLYRYARDTGDEELLRKANLTKELALAAPQRDGLFPSVLWTENETVTVDGRELRRPRGWDTARWGNSDRIPREHGITSDWYHVLDASWTALLMLRWHEELEPDARLVEYARTYGDRLLDLQDADGFFPGWLHPETREPGPVMNRTPETALSATFLFALADATGEGRYAEAGLRAIGTVLGGPAAEGRWEDYETYWSCCSWGRDEYLGRRVPRNAMFKSNTLSMFWTAEAAIEAYRRTGEADFLVRGRRALDELSMFQQVWQPPFIHVPAVGGFGVMNADGEWNDSRETLFAELFLRYYAVTGDPAYFERGVAALRSGFIMMYAPENPRVKAMWEAVYPWFGPEDYGFTMENYAHGGVATPEGEGMGVFTIYDWGNGAAAEAAMRIRDHWGDVYVDLERGRALGVDLVSTRRVVGGWEFTDRSGRDRTLRVVFDNGSAREIELRAGSAARVGD